MGHTKAVTGVAVDSTNRHLVSVSLDGTLRVWTFASTLQTEADVTLTLGSPCTRLELHRDSGLCAVAADDLVMRVFDVEAGRLVRKFPQHSHRITDFVRQAVFGLARILTLSGSCLGLQPRWPLARDSVS